MTHFTPNFEAIQKFGFDKQKISKKRFKDNLEFWIKDKKQMDFYHDCMLPERRFIFSDKDYGLSGIMFVIPIFFVGYFIHQLFWFDVHESYLLLMVMFAIMNMSVKTPEIVINKLSKIKIIIKTIFGSIIARNVRFISVSIIISILLIFINVEIKMYQTSSDIWDYSQITISETKQEGYLQSKINQIMKAINRFPSMSNEATTFLINDSR